MNNTLTEPSLPMSMHKTQNQLWVALTTQVKRVTTKGCEKHSWEGNGSLILELLRNNLYYNIQDELAKDHNYGAG